MSKTLWSMIAVILMGLMAITASAPAATPAPTQAPVEPTSPPPAPSTGSPPAACRACGVPCLELPSGAGHDAMFIAEIAETGMIFVRCREGVSHNPAEFVEPRDIAAGAAVLIPRPPRQVSEGDTRTRWFPHRLGQWGRGGGDIGGDAGPGTAGP